MLPLFSSAGLVLFRLLFVTSCVLPCAMRALAGSVQLDGLNDHIAIGHDTALTTQQFTIETWFKRQTSGGMVTVNVTSSYPLISRGNAANFFLGTSTDGRLHGQIMASNYSRFSILAPTPVPVGEWHHGAFTYDGAHLRLFVDGVKVAEEARVAELRVIPEGTRLGQIIYQGLPYGAWKGGMDETRIWNRALSEEEIARNCHAAITFAPGLVARWGFDATADLTSVSDGASAISATLANGASYSSTDVPPLPASVPVAQITNPAASLTVLPGAAVQLAAASNSPDVVKVSFYANLTKIGEDDTAPYELEWVPENTGHFIVRAVAEDASGLANGAASGVAVSVMPSLGSDALYLDGESAYADAGATPQFDLPRFTVEARFYMDGDGKPALAGGNSASAVALVARGNTPADTTFFLGIMPDSNLLMAGFGASKPMLVGQTPISRGTWHHAAVTFDGEVLRLFLDGQLEREEWNGNPPPIGATKRLIFGGWQNSNYSTGPTFAGLFHGALDEVRIWNYPRSRGAIAAARHANLPASPGLVSGWSMDGAGNGIILATGEAPADAVLTPRVALSGGPAAPVGPVPELTLTAPGEDRDIPRGGMLGLAANVGGEGGTIERVEFWSQVGKLGEDAAPPYSLSWIAGPTGPHWVNAVAFTSEGAASASSPVRVDVLPAGSGGVYFDGLHDSASAPSLSLPSDRFTIEGWFRREGPAQNGTFSAGNSPSFQGETIFALRFDYLLLYNFRAIVGIRAADSTLFVLLKSTSTENIYIETGAVIEPATWMHAGLTCDGATFRIYLDGVLRGEAAVPAPPAKGMVGVSLAGNSDVSFANFKGNFDEVRLWDHDRSASEIAGARGQQFATASGLVSRWAFSETTGNSANGSGEAPKPLWFTTSNPPWTQGLPLQSGTPPSVNIDSPAAQAVLPVTVPFNVAITGADTDGTVQKVELFLDSLKLAEDHTAPYEFEVTAQKIGTSHLRAVATDQSGLTATHRIPLQMFPPPGGNGLYFDGEDDSVRMPADVRLAAERFTVEAWLRRDGSGLQASFNTGIVPIIARGPSSGGINYVLGVQPDTGRLIARVGDTHYAQPAVTVIGTTSLPLGEWRHVALTYDGVALRLFVDGAPDGQLATSIIPAATATQHTMLGAWPTSHYEQSGAFHGFLDEVRIWNHARGQAAIAADRWRAIFSDPALLARWAMDEGSGPQLASTGALAISGTLTGPRWTIGHPVPPAPVPITNLTAGPVPRAGGSATLTAAATEDISLVEFYANGTKIGEASAEPWSFEFTPASPGRYVINVVTTTTTGGTGASNDVVWDVAPVPGDDGIYFDGIDDFVEMPTTDEFSLASFTAETWFRCEGPGRAGVYSSSGPISPILAMGRTWYIGLRPTDQRIVMGSGMALTASISPIEYGKWYHVALTGGPSGTRLYVDGVFQPFGNAQPVSFYSTSTMAIGTALAYEVGGSFHGSIDETRIWSVVRTEAEIAANRLKEIHNAPGLVSRWSSVATGVAMDSGSFSLHAALKNGARGTQGVDLVKNSPPTIALLEPLPNATLPPPVSLSAVVDDEVGETLSAEFRGREIARDADEFTIAVLPDLTNYAASLNGGTPATLQAMVDWIVVNRVSRKIAFVAQTGGIAPSLDSDAWNTASQTLARLQDPATTGLPFGIPYGATRGDDAFFYFTANFGPVRFAGKPWYGDGTTRSHVTFLRAGGVDIGVILIGGYDAAWLRTTLQAHPQRQFIIVEHDVLGASGVSSVLRDFPNVALALGGQAPGETRAIITGIGHSYHALSADFASRPNGGDGWMRLLTFSPLHGRIRVQTFSPTRNEFEVDGDSDFSLRWKSPLASPSAILGAASNLDPGATASADWLAPESGRRYEWQASVSDGVNTVPSSRREFSSPIAPGGQAPAISLARPLVDTSAALPCVVPITADAVAGDDAIERVEFLVDGLPIHSVTAAPFQFFWAPGATGTYQVSAAAIDRRGRRSESAPVQVSITPNTNVTIGAAITSPANNATLYDSGIVPIDVTTSGTAAVSFVEFYIDGVYAGRDTEAPFSFTWAYSAPATHSLQVVAFASSLQSAQSSFVQVSAVPLLSSTITRQPYLQMAAPNAVTVCWRSTQSHPARVRFGKAPGALTSIVDETVAVTDHAVRITGLEPNTRYYYGVGTHGSINAGNDNNTYFTTPPLPGRAKPTRIWALGTFGLPTAGQTTTRDVYSNFTGARGTDVMLMLGDNTSSSGSDAEYQYTFGIYASVLRRTCAWPAIGNHETAGSSTYNPAIAHYSNFHLPTAGECGGTPSGTEQYYSFDHANIHFVCLDSMTSDRSATGPMANWLRADLAATQARWRIAFWHHPPYSKGPANSDTVTRQIEMRTNIVPILEQFGVDLVLCGDGRNYQRSWFMAEHYGLSSTFSDQLKESSTLGRRLTDGPYVKPGGISPVQNGAVYLVSGNAAALDSASAPPLDHPAMAVNLRVLGTVVIDVNGPQMDVRMLQASGSETDSFSIYKPYGPTDSDGDQLPDDFELEHGLDPDTPNPETADSDGDGATDLFEFRAGTYPNDPASNLKHQVSRFGSSTWRVTFPTVIGMRYRVEYCDDLTGNAWTQAGADIAGTGNVVNVNETTVPLPQKRFYRVVARPDPGP